jgi:energy-coupling factor transport system permease protein
MGAGAKLMSSMVLSALAVAARTPWALGLLLGVQMAVYRLAGFGLAELWLDIRLFLLQTAIIVILYLVQYPSLPGLWAGLRTGLQILLFFTPGVILLRTTRSSQMMKSLQRLLPARITLVVFTSLRFIPYFAREFREIALIQRIRGARISPGELFNPRNWGDAFHSLMIPMLIRAIKTAQEAALSAEARGFGIRPDPMGRSSKISPPPLQAPSPVGDVKANR